FVISSAAHSPSAGCWGTRRSGGTLDPDRGAPDNARMHFPRLCLVAAVLLNALLAAARAADEAAPKSRAEALERVGIKLVGGPATVPLGKVAELKLPEGHHFVGPDSLDRFYELTQNMRSGNEVGVLIAPKWMLFFNYDDSGYVKDDEKDKLESDKLMQAMSEG